jgi:uncharacterized protein (DUF849 family)
LPWKIVRFARAWTALAAGPRITAVPVRNRRSAARTAAARRSGRRVRSRDADAVIAASGATFGADVA